MYHPPDLGCSRVEKRVFSSFFFEEEKKKESEFILVPQTTIELLLQLSSVTDGLVVGCYGFVASFNYTNHLWKSCKYFLWFHFPSQEKGKKEKTMNINSKRKKNPGKEIKHLLFFIVGKVAILSTFFDWRKSMYCTLKFEH